MSWAARYEGVCDYCGADVHVGDEIVWEDPDERTVRHVKCPEPERVCPRCWTVHAGECL